MLLVGLGNPGGKYERTRHNIGFRWLDRVHELCGDGRWRRKYRGHLATARIGGRPWHLLKPATYMNHSGEAVQAAMAGLRMKPESIWVAHDDLDLPFGVVRMKVGGGTGGHNGLKSILAQIGRVPFGRFRLGIGHPGTGADVVGYVLGRHGPAEEAALADVFDRATEALERLGTDGPERAMQWLHTPAAEAGQRDG